MDKGRCTISSCGQQRLWSDCTDEQADLSLRPVPISEGTFSRRCGSRECDQFDLLQEDYALKHRTWFHEVF